VSYGVSQRLREMGLRLALGANRGAIRRLIMGRSMVLAGGGAVLGLVGAVGVTRVMSGLLFGVSPTDPVTMATVTAALLGVAGIASLIPAERAVRVDPIAVLKEE
jgi:putative ABC transport system permease protein